MPAHPLEAALCPQQRHSHPARQLVGHVIASDTTEQWLTALPSLLTAGLIDGATKDASHNFHHATPFSYSVLTDVREGGLKRGLSTLLERPVVITKLIDGIEVREDGDEFMLYKFNGNERVPIQDLAAYFQLYHQVQPPTVRVTRRQGGAAGGHEGSGAAQVPAPA